MTGKVSPRTFVFLQGPHGVFFERLAKKLMDGGNRVLRINFNAGDAYGWRLAGAINYRGRGADWPDFLSTLLSERGVTDLVLFGDCRPLHRDAIRVCVEHRIAVHVFEEGYLRPNWITLERDGVNGHSSLPRIPDWYRTQAKDLPPWREGVPVQGSLAMRVREAIRYNLPAVLFAWRFPHFLTHRQWHPAAEAIGWISRYVRQPLIRRRARAALAELVSMGNPFFIFPLQLSSDSQVLVHSPYGTLYEMMKRVIESFARDAPNDACLVVKQHPLDNGLCDWRLHCLRLASEHKVADRVIYLEEGPLEQLIDNSKGLVTINSTAGTLALAAGKPVITVGRAWYDMPGLTFQGDLTDFWIQASPPDMELFDAVRRVLAQRCLVNGGFFSESGIDMAVSGAMERLVDHAPLFTAIPKTDFEPQPILHAGTDVPAVSA